MKLSILAGIIALLFVAEGAYAACSTPAANRVNRNNLDNLLPGNTVCASRGGDSWQEEHVTGGQLWDYKLGDGDPVDPRKQVGTWSLSGTGNNAEVIYNYGSGGTYTYEVWDNGVGADPRYSFCSSGTLEMDFTVAAGTNVGCP